MGPAGPDCEQWANVPAPAAPGDPHPALLLAGMVGPALAGEVLPGSPRGGPATLQHGSLTCILRNKSLPYSGYILSGILKKYEII